MTNEQHPLGPGFLQKTLVWLRIVDLKFSSSSTVKDGSLELDLAPDDPLFILLRDSIGATNVKLFGKLSIPPAKSVAQLETAALQVTADLTKGKGKATSLVFSSSHDATNTQFDDLAQQTSGLDVLGNKLGVVLALMPSASSLDLDMAGLVRFCEYEVPLWIKQLASPIKLTLRKGAKRNCVWIFTRPCTTVMRIEFQLDSSRSDPSSLNLKLKDLLPGSTDQFFMVMQRIVCFSPVFRTSAARSQLTLCSTFKFQGNDQAFKVRVTLQQDYITLLVVNESQNLGFSSLLHNILTHFKDKFQESGFATSLKDFALFFTVSSDSSCPTTTARATPIYPRTIPSFGANLPSQYYPESTQPHQSWLQPE
jgi:hypothetical protein